MTNKQVCRTCYRPIRRDGRRWVCPLDGSTECRDDAGRWLTERHVPA